MQSQKIKIGEHNIRNVPENCEGIIIRLSKTPAYNMFHKFCGYHYYYHINVKGIVYRVPDWATDKPIRDN